jgi:accessory gene regulator B
MLSALILSRLQKINKYNRFEEYQLYEIRYAILSILGDLSKLIFFLILFYLSGNLLFFIYAFIATTLLRIFIGGYHFKTYLSCLIFSTIYYSSLLFLCSIMSTQSIVYLLPIFSILLIILTPQVSENKKSALTTKKIISKSFTFLLVLIYILLFALKKDPIYSIGPLTIILQTLQLLFMKGGHIYDTYTKTKLTI